MGAPSEHVCTKKVETRVSIYKCGKPAAKLHEGIYYCNKHYPPNVEKEKLKRKNGRK